MKLTANDVHLMMDLYVFPAKPISSMQSWELVAKYKLSAAGLVKLDERGNPELTDAGNTHARTLLSINVSN